MSANDGSSEGYSLAELKSMSESEARETLTVNQYERWESLNDLMEQVEETEAEHEQQDETVAEVTVSADMDDLGTHVEVFGNDLLVYFDPEDEDFTDRVESLDDKFSGLDGEDPADLDPELRGDLAGGLMDLLSEVLVRWDGTDWRSLSDGQRETVLAQARDKWGLVGLQDAWFDILEAAYEDRESKEERIEKFLDEERRGRR